MYKLKIGKLYIYDISVSNDDYKTNFIYAIDLRPNLYIKLEIEEANELKRILSELGINTEIEYVNEGKSNEKENKEIDT